MNKFAVCPYFKGIEKDRSSYMIKCGSNCLLAFKKEVDRDSEIFNVCQGDMESCRPFLYRRLEEMGQIPQSYWSTELLKDTYKAINEAIEWSDNNMFEYIESVS